MKIALVHDYLSQDGGAEQVLRAFHDIWPEAPIFVLFHDKKAVQGFDSADIRESFMGKIPFAKKKYRWLLPWMPIATERHNVHEFDVVLSSTSAFAKGILTRPDTLHISYCHTPTRYLWTDTHEYLSDLKLNPVLKTVLPRLIHKLRLWDKMSVDRVDYFIANSNTVRQRIEKYYRRESDIMYPPVAVGTFSLATTIGDYYIAGGRLVPYKRFDIIVQTFNRLGWKIKIFGVGPELASLRRVAKPNIEFVGRVSDQEKAELIQHARAFIHPQVEDLGITPIEAMASGTPVIAYGVGGVTETVIPGKTGVFFYQQQWESLLDTLVSFDPFAWDRVAIRSYAQKYDEAMFKQKIKQYVESRYEAFRQGLEQCQLDIR